MFRPGNMNRIYQGFISLMILILLTAKSILVKNINGIIYDDLGNLWFNTGNDIERFDGESWISLNFSINGNRVKQCQKIASQE